MTQIGILAFTLFAEATEAESDCFGFFLTIGLLLLPLVPLFWVLKRAMQQNRKVADIAETQVELQREQTELQKRTNVLLE
jgi:flagellar biogenesis protein FliO